MQILCVSGKQGRIILCCAAEHTPEALNGDRYLPGQDAETVRVHAG